MIRPTIAGSALLVAAICATPCRAAGDESAFAARMLARLRAAGPEAEFRLDAADPLVIQMKHDGKWGEAQINLHRVHHYCQEATRADCEASLDNLARKAAAGMPEPTVAGLRLVVRSSAFVDRLRERPPELRPIRRQIGDDLFVLLASSDPNAVLFVSTEQLAKLGLAEEAAWRLASEQTARRLPHLPKPIDIVRRPVVLEDREFLTSVLAQTDAWRAIAQEVGPELLVTATSDAMMFVAALPDDPQMARFKQLVREDCERQERCISPNVYRFHDGRWVIAE